MRFDGLFLEHFFGGRSPLALSVELEIARFLGLWTVDVDLLHWDGLRIESERLSVGSVEFCATDGLTGKLGSKSNGSDQSVN